MFPDVLLLRPRVGSEPVGPPSEFLTLYALLFCLSELRPLPARHLGCRARS